MTTTPRTRALLAAVALTTLLTTGACASGGGDDTDSRAQPANAGGEAANADGAAANDRAAAGDGALREEAQPGAADDHGAAEKSAGDAADPQQQAIISTGTVSLEAKDVAAARLEVQQVLDKYRGSTSQQETSTGDDGDLSSARIVVRVPSDRFTAAVADLEKVATLTDSSTQSEDVTTEVIDVDVRVRAQERSVRRIEALLANAKDLRQLISIESELSRRQADLDSLKSQQKWLADQTSLSTITIYIGRTGDESDHDDPESGFLAGLGRGWDSFAGGLVGALTVLGFLLPWLLVLAVVLAPVTWLVRRSSAGRLAATTSGSDDTP